MMMAVAQQITAVVADELPGDSQADSKKDEQSAGSQTTQQASLISKQDGTLPSAAQQCNAP